MLLFRFSYLWITPFLIWGFFAHKKINENACYAVPNPLFKFYKTHAGFITAHSVDPDKRRHSTVGEAERHYIDIDHYSYSLEQMPDSFPKTWELAVEKFSEDTLRAFGIGPFNAISYYHKLKYAFVENDLKSVLRYSAELGHYISDLHVPLHTTENYNGQLSNQDGIHAFWESRLPELFYSEYDVLFEPVSYESNIEDFIWQIVYDSHALLPIVLQNDKVLDQQFSSDKYTNEERGEVLTKTHSRAYALAYHESMNGMVEARMRAATLAVATLWYSAWVDAGQPSIENLK